MRSLGLEKEYLGLARSWVLSLPVLFGKTVSPLRRRSTASSASVTGHGEKKGEKNLTVDGLLASAPADSSDL